MKKAYICFFDINKTRYQMILAIGKDRKPEIIDITSLFSLSNPKIKVNHVGEIESGLGLGTSTLEELAKAGVKFQKTKDVVYLEKQARLY